MNGFIEAVRREAGRVYGQSHIRIEPASAAQFGNGFLVEFSILDNDGALLIRTPVVGIPQQEAFQLSDAWRLNFDPRLRPYVRLG